MIDALDRYSMERSPQGNFDQMRLLDARLSLESMLVRESVQNSWDARSDTRGSEPVYFELRAGHFEGQRADLLRRLFEDGPSAGLPPSATTGSSLQTVLERTRIPFLIVGDRGTVGLTGEPVSRLGEQPDHQRFARFMLDMGRPPGSTVGGGTYGYGKTVLWRSSECATVLAYSRFRETDGRTGSRLMAAAMGDPHTEGTTERTGRHWWGVADESANILPVEGEAADRIARELGIWESADERTGTSVLILGARFSSATDVLRLREAVRWHCWPKWVEVAGRRDMEFAFHCDGEALDPLDPRQDPMLEPFASALARVLDGHGKACEVYRPIVTAGHVDWVLRALRSEPPIRGLTEEDQVSDVRPIEGPLNHVALVRRKPTLHVRFEEFPGPAPDGAMRAGVFLTAENAEGIDVEGAFARSEPPTHDDWAWSSMERGWDKTIVKTGLARLRDHLRESVQTLGGSGDSELAPLANVLGLMLETGAAPSKPGPSGPGGGRATRDLRVREGPTDLVTDDGQRYVRLTFDILGRRERPVRLSPVVAILDGDNRAEPVEGIPADQLWWALGREGDWFAGDSAIVEGDADDEGWELWVPIERDRRLRVSVHAEVTHG
jgi:hypothetical protein